MRDIQSWRTSLVRQLRAHWPENGTALTAKEMADVELGLHLLQDLVPGEVSSALWVLLSGYSFPLPASSQWTDKQCRMLGNACHLLPSFRNPSLWKRTIDQYRAMPEHLRGYAVAEGGNFTCKPVSVCPERFDVYTTILCRPVPHKQKQIKWAGAGEYQFPKRERFASVRIPDDLVFAPPLGHTSAGRSHKEPVSLKWTELEQTARRMDSTESEKAVPENVRGHWERRLCRVRLELWDAQATCLKPTDTLTIDGLFHLIGMVSSGKSTLMDVLAVWAANHGLHVTIVVSDVISVLNRAQQFNYLGLSVAPILGAYNRGRHIERLHNVLAAEEPSQRLVAEHEGFRWLSTACPLDGLGTRERPLELGEQPCMTLKPSQNNDAEADQPTPPEQACPLYGPCPFHQAQKDLVNASIWIATPASLVYTRVAAQLNPERVQSAEMVYRRSDLLIVDEADQVQMQLDAIFNPNQTLVSRGQSAWLGQLQQHVVSKMNREGCAPLGSSGVGDWCNSHDIVQTVQNRIYDLLLNSPSLQAWVEQESYFTDITLFYWLSQKLSGTEIMLDDFDVYLSDPLGERNDQELHRLAQLAINKNVRVQSRLREWIKSHTVTGVELTAQDLARTVEQLEFALLVAILQTRIHYLIQHWRKVETPLDLEDAGSLLFHRPPEEYRAVLPEPPMGQVLAFQYLHTAGEADKSGDLRFFRCAGVGRWLLLHFHELWQSDGIMGPHVLLLSGTSWAGTSPSCHLQVPVNGVLHSPTKEIAAINDSRFRFLSFVSDDTGKPITVSGKQGSARTYALQSLLKELARRNGFGNPGFLEQERDSLPQDRQRLLLLVGSYDESKAAAEFLTNLRPEWKGQVRYLTPDDSSFNSDWRSGDNDQLQRGFVHHFASTGAWILVAPLLAVERGHNILTENKERAAIGAAYFLVRPHSRPDDINFAVHSINKWAIDRSTKLEWFKAVCENATPDFTSVGDAFRRQAHLRWRQLLQMPMRYSTMEDEERDAVTWSHLVTIWQVIGRLVRGGSPAHVYFCDAAFAINSASSAEEGDRASTSLLVGMKRVLRPYFVLQPDKSHTESALVQALYGPLYKALETMGGLSDATP